MLRQRLLGRAQLTTRHLTNRLPLRRSLANGLDPGYPKDSPSSHLLERCLEAAVARGVDVDAPYEPWLPVDLMQTLLLDVHEALGCSWFSSIIIAVIGIRVISLPVSIAAIRGSREKALIQPKFAALMERQKMATAEGNQEKAGEVSKQLQDFTQKHGRLFMLKGTGNLIFFQVPLYITAWQAMLGFASHPDLFRGFAMEAPLWLDSLALADPYYFYPMLTAAVMLTNAELFGSIDTEASSVSMDGLQGPQAALEKYRPWIMRGSMVFFLYFTMSMPAGVFVFMSTNLVTASLLNRLLKEPALERLLEVPPPPDTVKDTAIAGVFVSPSHLTPLGSTLRLLAPAPAGQIRDAMAETSMPSSHLNVCRKPERSHSGSLSLPMDRRRTEARDVPDCAPLGLANLQVGAMYNVEHAAPRVSRN